MKKKALMISYRAPYPIKSGDKIRMFQNIKLLSELYDIDLIYLDDNKVDENTIELENYCNKIVKFRVKKMESIVNGIAKYIVEGLPLQVGYFYNKRISKWIKKHISEYNLVFCNHLRTAEYVMKYKNVIKVLDSVDAITFNYLNKSKVSKGIKKWVYTTEYKRVSRYEKRVYDEFDKTIIISERDREFIKRMGVKKLPTIVYNYVRDLGYKNTKTDVEEPSACFIGKMSTEPNVNAMLYFTNKIFPEIRKVYKDFQFFIIGGSVCEEIKKLNNIEGINVLGFVEYPAEIIQKCKVVVAPMVSGSGLQNKIIESMYLAKAVITTSIGAEGLAELSGSEIVIAENTNEFIDKMLYFLSDKNIVSLKKIEVEARNYVLKKYSYESIKSQFITALEAENMS